MVARHKTLFMLFSCCGSGQRIPEIKLVCEIAEIAKLEGSSTNQRHQLLIRAMKAAVLIRDEDVVEGDGIDSWLHVQFRMLIMLHNNTRLRLAKVLPPHMDDATSRAISEDYMQTAIRQ